jgi:predicted Zn finger-like uncharacterized protein
LFPVICDVGVMMDIVCPSCSAAYEIDEATVTESGRKVRCAACSTVWRVYPPLAETAPFVAEPNANPYASEPDEDIFGEGGPMLRQAIEEQAAQVDEPKTAAQSQNESVSAAAIDAMDETLANQDPANQDPANQDPANQDSNTEVANLSETAADISDDIPAVVTHEEPRQAKLTRLRPKAGANETKAKKSTLGSLFSWKTASIATALAIVGGGVYKRELVVRHVPQTAGIYSAIGMPVNLRGVEIRNIASRIIDDNGVNILVIDGDLQNVTKTKIDLPRLRFAVRGADGQEVYVWSAQTDKNNLGPGESLNFRRRLAAPPQDGKDITVRFLTKADTTAGIK